MLMRVINVNESMDLMGLGSFNPFTPPSDEKRNLVAMYKGNHHLFVVLG